MIFKCFQQSFVNTISGSLIRAPDFKNVNDTLRLDLIRMAKEMTEFDAEFITKVGLFIFICCTKFYYLMLLFELTYVICIC